jgi:peroxiredoxin
MNNKITLLISAAGLIVLIAVAVFTYNLLQDRENPLNQLTPNSQAPKESVPDFSIMDASGNMVNLSDYYGQPIVLNFWASWCPPCKNEMPDFNKVYEEYQDRVAFLMVNLTDGRQETVENGKGFIDKQGFTFPVYFDTKGEGARAYKINSIPQTFFIDRDGSLIQSFMGGINEKTLRQYVDIINNSTLME